MAKIIGWTDPYQSIYKKETFGNEQRQALIGLIRKRQYYFTYMDHVYFPYCAPLFKGNYFCELTKKEFDSVMAEAYNKTGPEGRKLPMDVITKPPENGAIME